MSVSSHRKPASENLADGPARAAAPRPQHKEQQQQHSESNPSGPARARAPPADPPPAELPRVRAPMTGPPPVNPAPTEPPRAIASPTEPPRARAPLAGPPTGYLSVANPAPTYPPLADFYNPIRGYVSVENRALFDKVKKQLNSYLAQTRKSAPSASGLKHRPPPPPPLPPQSQSLSGARLGRAGGRLVRKSRQDVVRGIIASSLSDREKVLLKYLLASDESDLHGHIFLTKTLKRHLYKCLLKITMKVGVRSGLLDLVRRCHLVAEALSVDQAGKLELGICENFTVASLKTAHSRAGGPGLCRPHDCDWRPYASAERVRCERNSDRMVLVLSAACRACCVAVALVHELVEEGLLLEYTELGPVDLQALPAAAVPTGAWLAPRTAHSMSATSALLVLRLELTFHSLETTEAGQPRCCQQEIQFTYQPNPFNHLIHLYLGLRHQNN